MVETLTSPNKETRILVEVKSMKVNGFDLIEWKKNKLVNSRQTNIKTSREFVTRQALDCEFL